MADFVPIEADIEIRITGQHTGGKKMYNIIHADCGSPHPTLAEVTAAANAVASWVQTTYAALYSQYITVNEIRARSNAEEPGPVYTNASINEAGALLTDMESMDTTMCVNLLSGLTGASNRGKFYVFTPDEPQMTQGIFTSGYQTQCEAAMVALRTDLASAGFAMAIESRRYLRLRQIVGQLGQIIPSHLQSRKANHGI
jgi:hypothetical protein